VLSRDVERTRLSCPVRPLEGLKVGLGFFVVFAKYLRNASS